MAQLDHFGNEIIGLVKGGARRPIMSVAVSIAVMIAKWETNVRTRRHLGKLDDRLLDDIGLTREAAKNEAARPFWQG